MKNVFILLSFLFCLFGCCSVLQKQSEINANPISLSNETVAILSFSEEHKEWYTSCTGVFISETKIITAHHCTEQDDDEASSVGTIIHFKTIDQVNVKQNLLDSSAPHLALVISENIKADLAILSIIDDIGEHPFAELRSDDLPLGSPVSIVGHTTNMKYTFLSGIISALRDKNGVSVYQISAPAFYGNSGGGAFDSNGKLIGICTTLSMRAPNVVFFVSQEEILSLIRGT